MSSASGPSGRTVISRLQEQSSHFSLEQVYRILRQLARKSGQPQRVAASIRAIPRYRREEVLDVQQQASGWYMECAAEALTGPPGYSPLIISMMRR